MEKFSRPPLLDIATEKETTQYMTDLIKYLRTCFPEGYKYEPVRKIYRLGKNIWQPSQKMIKYNPQAAKPGNFTACTDTRDSKYTASLSGMVEYFPVELLGSIYVSTVGNPRDPSSFYDIRFTIPLPPFGDPKNDLNIYSYPTLYQDRQPEMTFIDYQLGQTYNIPPKK